MSLLAVAEAQRRLLALARPLAAERVALVEAAGRWAAEDLHALRSQPAADLSAMDGYAIRHAELPGPWQVVGESAAGGGLDRALAPGEAARIFTGAPIPAGADCVLVQEEAARDGERLMLAGGGPAPGGHVRRRASDFASGDRLIEAGAALGPARLALAAIGGHGALPVRRRARVALISTGDELVPPGSATPGTLLPASNAPMLAGLLDAASAEVSDRGIIRDDLDAIAEGFRNAAGAADIIVTTGGASVGDRDLVRPALERAGADLAFWRIAMQPGKPLLAGTLGGAVVLGLPGNPVSAYVTALLFLRPLVARLGGAADPLPRLRHAILGSELPAVGGRQLYLRARIDRDGRAIPVTGQDSAALAMLASADCLIVRPPHAPPAAPGDPAEILDLP